MLVQNYVRFFSSGDDIAKRKADKQKRQDLKNSRPTAGPQLQLVKVLPTWLIEILN